MGLKAAIGHRRGSEPLGGIRGLRIILDECLPKQLTGLSVGHEVIAAWQVNWLGLSNGRLSGVANQQFDVLLTVEWNPLREHVSVTGRSRRARAVVEPNL
jgi:hypothetical protein